jgi:hypothetical protein
MASWSADIEDVVRHVLTGVTYAEFGRQHLGRPFITAYQLAIMVRRLEPELASELEIGGEDVGQHRSLAQFLARELSQRIKREGDGYFIEGAQLASTDISTMRFRHPAGHEIASSVISAGYDTSMFRLRE